MTEQDKEIMARLKAQKELPDVEPIVNAETELKEPTNDENCIMVNGKPIEIKPTKLRYFANNSVSFYRILDTVPLPQIYMMTDEENGLDGETAILTFVAAVLDDLKLAKRIYREMDASQLLRLVEIFKRLNGIESREEAAKKATAAKAKA